MKHGYKGQGVTICSKENVLKYVFNDVFGLEYDTDKSDKYAKHATLVMDYICQVAPDANKLAIETQGKIDGPYNNRVLHSAGMDYLQQNVPDIMTTSYFKSTDIKEPKKSLYKKLYDKGCFLVCASGNDDIEELEPLTQGDVWKAVGACRLVDGQVKIEKDYATGEEMDFVSFHNLRATWDNKKHLGTSFSAPLFAGMLALVQCFFKSKTGKKLNHEQLINFIKDNCIDLGKEGHDTRTGYGLLVLPAPESIQIKKYNEDYKESEEEKMSKFNKIDEIPDWGKATIEKLIEKKVLKGDENNNLNISEDLLRTFVIHDRMGLYDLNK